MSDFNIDSNLSVYQLVERNDQNSVINHRRTMSLVSREIENASLADGANTMIFAGFQRTSKFIPQIRRYRRLATIARHIYVFAIFDFELPPIENITYVPLKTSDRLAKEWFLVSYGTDYFSALATEEITHVHTPDTERLFRGVWTFDVSLVSILHEWLSGIVGLRHEQRAIETHDVQNQIRLMINMIKRLDDWRTRMHKKPRENDDLIRSELTSLMKQGILPALQDIKTYGADETEQLRKLMSRSLDSP